MPDEPAISIRNLTKHYGSLVALRDLDLDVYPGQIFGFLGLNGAGKTTTIRILLDLLRPTHGRASVLGKDCQSHGIEVRRQVGYMPGEMGLYGDMTGRESLDFFARLSRQVVRPELRRRLEERMELSSADLRRKLREYSTGMKRKLGIILAFQGDPPVLILDEPTEGLDPVMQEACYDLLFEARSRGRTVFMSSHVLSEVERVCVRIALLRRGELALLRPVEEIRKLAARRVRVVFYSDVSPGGIQIPDGFKLVEQMPREWLLHAHAPMGALLGALAPLPVRDLEIEEARLEDVLIRYYREGAA